MALTISEADWKVYKRIREMAVERYAQRVLDEVTQICRDDTSSAADRFARLPNLSRERDKASFHIFDTLRRSSAIHCLMMMCRYDLVTDDEMQAFSPQLQQRIRPA